MYWSWSCGLYYKHVTIVTDDSSIVNKWGFNLIDDARVVIYDLNRFIIQATDLHLGTKICTNKYLAIVGLYFFILQGFLKTFLSVRWIAISGKKCLVIVLAGHNYLGLCYKAFSHFHPSLIIASKGRQGSKWLIMKNTLAYYVITYFCTSLGVLRYLFNFRGKKFYCIGPRWPVTFCSQSLRIKIS